MATMPAPGQQLDGFMQRVADTLLAQQSQIAQLREQVALLASRQELETESHRWWDQHAALGQRVAQLEENVALPEHVGRRTATVALAVASSLERLDQLEMQQAQLASARDVQETEARVMRALQQESSEVGARLRAATDSPPPRLMRLPCLAAACLSVRIRGGRGEVRATCVTYLHKIRMLAYRFLLAPDCRPAIDRCSSKCTRRNRSWPASWTRCASARACSPHT